jgi:hypothetical protein
LNHGSLDIRRDHLRHNFGSLIGAELSGRTNPYRFDDQPHPSGPGGDRLASLWFYRGASPRRAMIRSRDDRLTLEPARPEAKGRAMSEAIDETLKALEVLVGA